MQFQIASSPYILDDALSFILKYAVWNRFYKPKIQVVQEEEEEEELYGLLNVCLRQIERADVCGS
jgi:hypothetical protein